MTKFANFPYGWAGDWTECTVILDSTTDAVSKGEIVALDIYNTLGNDTAKPGSEDHFLYYGLANSDIAANHAQAGIVGVALHDAQPGESVSICLRGLIAAMVGSSSGTTATAGEGLYVAAQWAPLDIGDGAGNTQTANARMVGTFLDADTALGAGEANALLRWIRFDGVTGVGGPIST